ncbi:ryanodine-sensitive calcium-release channel [Aureococcus anophagefferens]|nr:ryanodine-sensitive calcium-release channel [Aureococcus anophagefferens]
MVLFALVARATVDAAFEVYENADVGHGRLGALALLGSNVTSPRACQALCVGACRSFVFYHSDYRDVAQRRRATATLSGAWRPFYSDLSAPLAWGRVTSGQRDPRTVVTPCADRGDCSYNGVCSDAGTPGTRAPASVVL